MHDLREMATFVAVVQSGSFSAAAAALKISKSLASKQVSRLEDRLGARLLNRTTRRLSLTEVGATYYQRCTLILDEIEGAALAVARLQSEPRGTLRVNGPVSFGALHLHKLLPAFMARYPELTVELILNDRFVDLVDEGFDVAIRIAKLLDSSLVARKLAPNRRVVCASPEYWRRHGKPRRPVDLKRYNCIAYAYQATQNRWPFHWANRSRSVPVRGNFSTNNGEMLRTAALEGIGVALIPTFIVGEDLRAGRLEAVLREFEERDNFIYAVYPHGRHLSGKARAFVDFLAESFPPVPHWDAP